MEFRIDDLVTEERLSEKLLDAILFILGHVEWVKGRGGSTAVVETLKGNVELHVARFYRLQTLVQICVTPNQR